MCVCVYSTSDVPKYLVSKIGVPVPVHMFPGNLALHKLIKMPKAKVCSQVRSQTYLRFERGQEGTKGG